MAQVPYGISLPGVVASLSGYGYYSLAYRPGCQGSPSGEVKRCWAVLLSTTALPWLQTARVGARAAEEVTPLTGYAMGLVPDLWKSCLKNPS